MRLNLIFGLFFLLLICRCTHPESDKFDRDNRSSYRISKGKNPTPNIEPEDMINENSNIIKMENENGVKYVWIEINGLNLRFIFDTGASNICISPAEATVLFRQGTLKEDDILSTELFQDATGRISEGTKINLRSIKIGNVILENIEATVIDNVNAPLLLGQSVLEKFGSIEIDNIHGVIILK